MASEIWTIGHSTRELEAFLAMLADNSVQLLADVRRFPGSRRHPQFGEQALSEALHARGIGYQHFGELGGRRSRRLPDSPNTAWRVEAFNAYADYMETAEFQDALAALMVQAEAKRTAIMCSEAVPWRCHRRLIADALTVRGWNVRDILGPHKVDTHRLTEFARVNGTTLSYPAEPLFGQNEARPER